MQEMLRREQVDHAATKTAAFSGVVQAQPFIPSAVIRPAIGVVQAQPFIPSAKAVAEPMQQGVPQTQPEALPAIGVGQAQPFIIPSAKAVAEPMQQGVPQTPPEALRR